MKLIAKKPCSFGGEQFYIGDEIPAEIVLDPKAQEKMGVLVCVDAEGQPQPEPQTAPTQRAHISVSTDKGPIDLEVSSEALNEVFAVLMNTAESAAEIVADMTEGDALLLLHLADSRKSIKAAAEARAKAIEEAGEQ